VTSILVRILNGFAELIPAMPGAGLGSRLSPPTSGTLYRVRNRVTVSAVLLPLTPPVHRFEVSLAPTTRICIAAATRPDDAHVFAHLEMPEHALVIPEPERAAALATGYLLEVPRRILQSRFVLA
jgi:hypothetical protein